MRHGNGFFVGWWGFTAREEWLPQLEVRVLVVIGIIHRHRSHVANVPADVAYTAYASLVSVLIVLVLMTHLAFSLTEAINDEEEKRERNGGSDARGY